MMENIKEIPYGIANFVEVAEQNMYYVDKTMYLPCLLYTSPSPRASTSSRMPSSA